MPGIGGTGIHGTREIGTLFDSELWWRDQYRAIEAQGYILRSRYHPNWRPSWKRSGKDFFSAEDGQPTLLPTAMDATRAWDGRQVMFKKKLMVMPFLRSFDSPRFQTYGEFVSFFSQICDGLLFMHERNIAHRDCTANNIMLDPSGMYPDGFHPIQVNRRRDFRGRAKRFTRTLRPTRYYLIDFGLSRRYSSRNALDQPIRGGDKSAPEHRVRNLCNPFHTDIYYLGNLVRERFFKVYNGFGFMAGLVNAMTDENPAERPTIENVISRFSYIRDSLSEFKLRSIITSKKDPRVVTTYRYARQVVRTAQYMILQKAAIPYA
ncbi:kinase-like domain-containing protein [Russula aff. rugulosa BPL654]|nr:kinase-like domain-containing protein [Russula aff. rugulosa BPL654]